MKYTYEIPPKLVKKNGFFGTISNYDIGMAAGLAAIGFLIMLVISIQIYSRFDLCCFDFLLKC